MPTRIHPHWAWIGPILLATGVLGSRSLFYPLDPDHAVFAYGANVILDGGVLYREVFDPKPPGIFYWTALAFGLFGERMIAIRILDLVWQGATAVMLGLIAFRLVRSRAAAFVAGCLYLLAYFQGDPLWLANSDSLLTLPVALAVLCVLGGLASSRLWRWAAAGCCCALAMMFKPTIGTILPVMLAVAAAPVLTRRETRPPHSGRTFLQRSASFLFGVALPLSCMIALLRGGLADFVEIQFGLNPVLAGGAFADRGVLDALRFALERFPRRAFELVLPLAIAASIWYLIGRRPGAREWLVLGWLVAAAISWASQLRFFAYHSYPLLGPLSVMSAMMAAFVFRQAGKTGREPAIVLSSVLIAFGARGTVVEYSRDAGDIRRFLQSDNYLERHYAARLGELIDIAALIRDGSAPDARIFVLGEARVLYFLAGRRSTSRFVWTAPIGSAWAREAHRQEFLQGLLRAPPAFLVVGRNDANPVHDVPDSETVLRGYPAIVDLLAERYVEETRFRSVRVFRLR